MCRQRRGTKFSFKILQNDRREKRRQKNNKTREIKKTRRVSC
jgi:hypothetical protein